MEIRKFNTFKKVVLIQGSPRSEKSCPNRNSKTSEIVQYVVDNYSDKYQFDVIDLSLSGEHSIIQPCKGCISSAGGFHCNYPCSCYEKNSTDLPDYMYDGDIYKKLEQCDAFIVFSPIHWFSVTSQVKALFDRLVCVNLTITQEQARELFTSIKDFEQTSAYDSNEEYKSLLKNHFEGKYAGFYIHGDDGANDYSDRKLPKSAKDLTFDSVKQAIVPLIHQCKYSGIFVPDDLVKTFYMNKDLNYSDANIDDKAYKYADEIMTNLKKYI